MNNSTKYTSKKFVFIFLEKFLTIVYNKRMEVGIDIEQNERFKNISEHFINRVYTPNEIEFANKFVNKHEQFCAMWCVKEATVKAFSNLKIPFLEIEISKNETGRPIIVKNKTITKNLEKLGLSEIKVSMSHSKDYSTAIVIIC